MKINEYEIIDIVKRIYRLQPRKTVEITGLSRNTLRKYADK